MERLRARVEELERDLGLARAAVDVPLAQILSCIHDPVARFDRGRRLTWSNRAFDTLADAAVASTTWTDALNRAFQTGGEVRETFRFAADDGVHSFECRFIPHRNDSDEVEDVTMIARAGGDQKQTVRDLE